MRIVGTALAAGTIGISFLLAQGGWIRAGTGQIGDTEKQTQLTGRKVWVGYNRFRDCRGMTVENVDGEKLGTINDLIMEMQSGRPAYVVVKSGGFGRQRFVIVPAPAIALGTVKAGIAGVDLTRGEWKRAPEFSRMDLPTLSQPEKERQIAGFYEQARKNLSRGNSSNRQESELSSTGRVTDQINGRGPNGRYQMGNDLIGKEVVARQKVQIGNISDVVVDLAGGKPSFAIISAKRLSETGERFAVPLRLLRVLPGRTAALGADRRDFEHAKPFRESNMENSVQSGGNEIYRYEH